MSYVLPCVYIYLTFKCTLHIKYVSSKKAPAMVYTNLCKTLSKV